MAMYPNATNGYMPFVKPVHKRQAAKKNKVVKSKAGSSNDMKTYRVTLRDSNGYTYTYIIQADADPTSKSMPSLIGHDVKPPAKAKGFLSSSMPNMNSKNACPPSPETSRRHALLAQGKDDLTKCDDGEKKGLFTSIINFIKRKTGGSKYSSKTSHTVKSKRKTKPVGPKKRQRTISATPSNLDTIHESPHEDDFEGEDTDSYTHDSESESDNDGSES